MLVTGHYAARESDTLGVSGADVVDRMVHPDAQYVTGLKDAVATLSDRVEPGDVVITLGAGDGYLIGERLLQDLQERQSGE